MEKIYEIEYAELQYKTHGELHSFYIELYKQDDTYIAELRPSFYIKDSFSAFNNVIGDCKVFILEEYRPGEYPNRVCKITKGKCYIDDCPKMKKEDKKSENEIREKLEDLLEDSIRKNQRDLLEIENKIRLALFDNENIDDLEKEFLKVEKMIDELYKINPKTIKLVYKPTLERDEWERYYVRNR